MKIIIIAEVKHYKNWIGKTYYDILVNYKKNSKNNIIIIWSNYYKRYNLKKIQNLKADLIVFFDTDKLKIANYFRYIFDLNIPIFYCGLDLFHLYITFKCNFIKKVDSIIFFGNNTKVSNSYKNKFPNINILNFKGRFINNKRYYNYKLEKKFDILLYGTRNINIPFQKHEADQEYIKLYEKQYNKIIDKKHNFYPLRERLENLLIKNSYKYNLKILPQKCIYNAKIANEDLSKLINQSYLTIASCSRADTPFSKYFEIAGSYSAILGNYPSDYKDLFENNIIYVNEWMDDKQILNIIDNALKNKEKLWEMTKRLGDIIHNEYDLKSSVEDFDKVFEKNIIK